VSVNLNVTNSSFLLKKYDIMFMFVKGELSRIDRISQGDRLKEPRPKGDPPQGGSASLSQTLR
jgi:hypothetical protein